MAVASWGNGSGRLADDGTHARQGNLPGVYARGELLRGGISAHTLRSRRWTQVAYGFWEATRTGGELERDREPLARIHRAARLIEGSGALGGWAAAYLHGFTDLDGQAADGTLQPLMLCVPPQLQRRRHGHYRVVRSDLHGEIDHVDGIPVTDLVRTTADLARLTTSSHEAVVAVDVMLRRQLEVPARLGDWMAAHRGWRGLPQARRVLQLARAGVESPQETRLRLAWAVGAGVAMPEPNQWLYTHTGELLGRADLLDREAGVVGEYDGVDHAGAARRSRDHARREAMQAHGLIVLQHTWADLGPRRDETIRRIRAARSRGLARERSADRWSVGPPPPWAT